MEKQSERVKRLQETYPKYDKYLDSKCEHPELYGIKRANATHAVRYDYDNFNIHVRIPIADYQAIKERIGMSLNDFVRSKLAEVLNDV